MSERLSLDIVDICGLSVLGVCYLWVFSIALYQLMKKVPKNRNTSDWEN
jgi:hypothetical protein|tara:strand:+ start:175 stop:321 length:147 start_codon:yes stop_codon:yes gene_type:complete